jgi:N-acyl-D-amino-acid deacylase
MHDLVIKGGNVVDGTGAAAVVADVAVTDGVITEIGDVTGEARRTIDADGLVVAPGWVDVHTHYDGQVTWDPDLSPSSWHGCTTVVMGNCGVGFAPVRPGGQDFLIELMESVEDIPGSALNEGISWEWESFGEYMDALARAPHAIDVAAQVPHAALRAYVMGERAHDNDPTADDIATMARLTGEALSAGAVGFTTSRTILHSSKHGLIPGTNAVPEELMAIGDVIKDVGHGVFQLVSDHLGTGADRPWLLDMARRTGATVTYSLAQAGHDPDGYRAALEAAEQDHAEGLNIVPQVACRPTGMLFGLQSSLHPFSTHKTYRALANLPLAERVARLSQPEVREALVSEGASTGNMIAKTLMSRWNQMFPLGDPPDYEPPASASVAAVAAREGRSPEEVVLDWLLERDGKALLFAPLASYAACDHEAIKEMLVHPRTVSGLSDGGAHCGLICDVSFPTFLLSHWVKGRTRGDRLSLETAINLQTAQTADLYGFADRGRLRPGLRGDINVIDMDALALHAPEMAFDLPAGGRRLVQRATGYKATIVAGEAVMEDGEATGARPGALIRA